MLNNTFSQYRELSESDTREGRNRLDLLHSIYDDVLQGDMMGSCSLPGHYESEADILQEVFAYERLRSAVRNLDGEAAAIDRQLFIRIFVNDCVTPTLYGCMYGVLYWRICPNPQSTEFDFRRKVRRKDYFAALTRDKSGK